MIRPAPPKFRGPRRAPQWVVLLILVAIAGWRLWNVGQRPAPPLPADETTAFVQRVVDGDTLLLDTGERVRLLGVDTPETKRENTPIQPWGPEAHEFSRELVEGKTVRLGLDREKRDRYDRLLAYVYIDGVCLNEELLRAGLGHALLKHPYRDEMKRRFRLAEQEARDAHRGVWSGKRTERQNRKGQKPEARRATEARAAEVREKANDCRANFNSDNIVAILTSDL